MNSHLRRRAILWSREAIRREHQRSDAELLAATLICFAVVFLLLLVGTAHGQELHPAADAIIPVRPVSDPPARSGADSGQSFSFALAGLGTLSAIDGAQSLSAFAQPTRYREANPIFQPVSGHPVAFAATKAALTGLTLYSLHRLHAKHPRVAWAVWGVVTAAEGLVVQHNARIVR